MGDHYSFAWTSYRADTSAHSRTDSSSFVSLPYRCALPESNIRAAVEDDLEPFEAAAPWQIQPSSPPSLAAEDGTHSFYESVSPSPPQFTSLGLSHYEAPTHYNHNNNNNSAYTNIDCSDLALASSYNSHSRSGSLSYDISPPQSSQPDDSTTLLVTNTPEPPVLYLTEEYKALAEPLSAWIADYLTKVMAPEDSAQLVPSLAAFIRSVLWSTMLQPSAIFLALWYLSKFPSEFLPMRETDDQTALKFREVLFGEGDESSDDAACRKLFVCIAMLADRELHDNCFSSATWSEITRIPMADLAALDYCSLNMLSHSLWVPPTAYADWVSALRHYHGTISPESLSPQHGRRFHDIITAQLEHVHVTLTHGDGTAPVFIAPGEQLLPQASQQVEEFESDIDLDEDGPLPQEYVPRRVWSRYSSESRTTVSTPLTPCSAACAQCAQESYTKAQDQRHQWFPDPPSGSSSHLSAYDAYVVRHKNWRSVDMDVIPRYSSSSSLIETGPPSSPTPMTRSDYSAYSVRQQWLLA